MPFSRVWTVLALRGRHHTGHSSPEIHGRRRHLAAPPGRLAGACRRGRYQQRRERAVPVPLHPGVCASEDSNQAWISCVCRKTSPTARGPAAGDSRRIAPNSRHASAGMGVARVSAADRGWALCRAQARVGRGPYGFLLVDDVMTTGATLAECTPRPAPGRGSRGGGRGTSPGLLTLFLTLPSPSLT